MTTASDASVESGISNLAALAKDTQTSDLDSSSSIIDAEKTKVENKDEKNGNGKFERTRRSPPRSTGDIYDRHSDADYKTNSLISVGDKDPYQEESEDASSPQLTPISTAELVTESDSQSIHQISVKTEINHGSASGEGADANHEAETAFQAATHLDSLDPVNPSVEQDDTRRNASIRVTIKGLQESAVTALFHVFLAFILIFILVYLELILPQDDRAYFCDRPSTMVLLNTFILLLSWETFVLIDIMMKDDLGSREIRYYDVEEIPDIRLTVLNQLRFHRIISIVTPLIAWIWFWMFANGPVAQLPNF